MRISDIKLHVGGTIMAKFNAEVNQFSRFLALYFDVKPSAKAIKFIEENGCSIKEIKWAEVGEHEPIHTTKWEVVPCSMSEYEFMGFWEESGGKYKMSILGADEKMKDGWLSLDEMKEKVSEFMRQYDEKEYDLNYVHGDTRNWFYRDWKALEQEHYSARYWAGVEQQYKIVKVERQEGKRVRIEFERSVY